MAKGTPLASLKGFSRFMSAASVQQARPITCIINVVCVSPQTAVSSPLTASITAMTTAAEPATA